MTAADWPVVRAIFEQAIVGGHAAFETEAPSWEAWDSVYVADEAQGRGVGKALLTELVERAERDGIWTVQAGIFPENEASIALRGGCGFRIVGVRERIGRLTASRRSALAHSAQGPGETWC